MTRSRMRTARKKHVCSDCRRPIKPGAEYLEHVCSPNDPDIGYTRWVRSPECQHCAESYGRLRDSFGRFWKQPGREDAA